MSSYKIDLHTHSHASHDGGLGLENYSRALERKLLDYIAITDHNEISFAMKARDKLGDRIIVGEEIMTKSGEVIGLFLKHRIESGLGLREAAEEIKSQGGIVYIPHPLETVRSGIQSDELEKIIDFIDIIETNNGRAFFGKKSVEAKEFAKDNKIVESSSSDSHGWYGWGNTYSQIESPPKADNLVGLLKKANHFHKNPTLRAILYPKYNKLRRVLT